MSRFLVLSLFAALLTGCATPKMDYEGCETRMLFWAIGPKAQQPFIDVCYTELDVSEINKYFNYVPIPGFNQDTRQAMDNNQDGISGNGRLIGDKIRWGGNACKHYARRIVQKDCKKLGNASRTGGCEWVAIQITPKAGVKDAYISTAPVSQMRLFNGEEVENEAVSFTTGFKTCR